MPLHIKRLILVFALFIALFLVLRHFLVPESFGQYGHYRGKALEEIASREVHHVGVNACASCHDTIVNLKASGLHETLTCEGCHGAGYLHVKSPKTEKLFIPTKVRDFCGVCHQKNAARGKDQVKQIDLKLHPVHVIPQHPNVNLNRPKNEIKCTECHNPHEPWQ